MNLASLAFLWTVWILIGFGLFSVSFVVCSGDVSRPLLLVRVMAIVSVVHNFKHKDAYYL